MRISNLVAAAAVVLGLAGAAQGQTHRVFDDFESYGAASLANFNGFDQLVVTNGTVDYIHEPDFGLTTPYGSGLVDLDGSTGDGGRLSTDWFSSNIYSTDVRFEFDAAGNGRGGADSLTFGFAFGGPANIFAYREIGGVRTNIGLLHVTNLATFTVPSLASDAPWTHYVYGFTISQGQSYRGFVETASADSVGPLVDNVRLTAEVPEPATWALMIGGFGLAGAALRRRGPVAA